MSCEVTFEIACDIARGDRRIVYDFRASEPLVALVGPSGAGKTSLLDAIAGLVKPRRGRIVVASEVLFDAEAGIDLAPERRRCGYVFQDNRLFPHRTVRQNLLFGWTLARPGNRWMDLERATGFLGIGHLLDRMPATLSGGEAQRVAIGRALLSGPRFLLMDEPLASLDAPRRDDILGVVEQIRDELGLPILYVSHDRAEVARLAAKVVPVA